MDFVQLKLAALLPLNETNYVQLRGILLPGARKWGLEKKGGGGVSRKYLQNATTPTNRQSRNIGKHLDGPFEGWTGWAAIVLGGVGFYRIIQGWISKIILGHDKSRPTDPKKSTYIYIYTSLYFNIICKICPSKQVLFSIWCPGS